MFAPKPAIILASSAFFCKVFGIERGTPSELQPLPDEELMTTKTGNVLGDFGDAVTIPDETANRRYNCAPSEKRSRHINGFPIGFSMRGSRGNPGCA